MKEKEKIFLAVLGLIVSLLIFVLNIFYTIDFSSIKVSILGYKMINYLSENQYAKFYENLHFDSSLTRGEFIEGQENINKILGDIKEYKYIGTYRNKNISGEDNILLEYDANFSKFADEPVKITLVFKYTNNKWQVSQYKFQLEGKNDNIQLIKNVNYINANSLEQTKETKDAMKIINDFIQNYDKGNYNYIYTLLNNELKEKGNESEFIRYLENQHNKYGQISRAKFDGCNIGKDKSEYKFNYHLGDEKIDGILYITLWVRIEDKVYLSGINFSENVW